MKNSHKAEDELAGAAALPSAQNATDIEALKMEDCDIDGDEIVRWRSDGANDGEEVGRLLNRVLRGVREFEPDKKACCALWHGEADSDGCGTCFKCFEADLAEAIKLLPSPPVPSKEPK